MGSLITSKRCSMCRIVKSKNEFWKRKRAPDGLRCACIDCERIHNKTYYADNYEKMNKGSVAWHKDNADRIRELDGKRRQKPKRKEYMEKWRSENKDRVQQYRKRNQTKRTSNGKESEYRKKWRSENPIKAKESDRRKSIKRASTPKGRIDHNFSSAIWQAIKILKAGRSWEKLVGYNVDQLYIRLNDTMPSGYTWDDYMKGKLHIDHIIPKCHFIYETTDCDQFLECWGLQNLQLLTAHDNFMKNANIQ